MKGFIFGVLVSSGLWGAVFYWQWQKGQAAAPLPGPAVVASDESSAGAKERKPRRRRARRAGPESAGAGAAQDGFENEEMADQGPEPMVLTAADTRAVGRGDDLSRPDVLQLDMADDSSGPELSQEDIDERFRARQSEILSCIEKSRPDDVTYVPGKVTVKFRIQRSGQVRGVRVEAPAILQKGGLYECIRGVVSAMRFPASSGSQVVTFPYQLS